LPSLGRQQFSQEKNAYILAWAVVFLYLVPYAYFGPDAPLLIHDNLDANFVWFKVLIDSGANFQANLFPIRQIADGVPRLAFPAETDGLFWLYKVLGPISAYSASRALMSLAGFAGMTLLLRRHVIPDERSNWIAYGVAACFATLPFWPAGFLSVAGMPLVLWSFLNIRQGDNAWHNWLIIVVFPFFSSLVLSGFFLLCPLGVLWLWDASRHRVTRYSLMALLVLALSYVLVNYRLFFSVLFEEGFVSHRVEFLAEGISLAQSMKRAFSLFVSGQYHAHSLHSYVILPVVFGFAVCLCWRCEPRLRRVFLVTAAFILVTSVLYGIWGSPTWGWEGGLELKRALNTVLPINLSRAHFLHPALWMILFAISLAAMQARWRRLGPVVALVIGFQIAYQFSRHELWVNRKGPSVSQFFAEKQFREIGEFIGKDKSEYRVASLGIHPSVAQFNGFYTLDGYLANYPLEYKHAFRKIIAGELERDAGLKKGFDGWGSRFYLFSSELKRHGGYLVNRSGNRFVVEKLSIDQEAFRKMGGRYIFSGVRINESANPGIRLRRTFLGGNVSAWDIYLYEVESDVVGATS